MVAVRKMRQESHGRSDSIAIALAPLDDDIGAFNLRCEKPTELKINNSKMASFILQAVHGRIYLKSCF